MVEKTTAFLGLGNPLKGDDAAGIHFVKKLKDDLEKENKDVFEKADFFIAGSDPLSFAFKIANGNYKRVVLVDACIFEGEPGDVKIFSSNDVLSQNFAMTTHNYDLGIFFKTLEKSNVEVFLIGILPKIIEETDQLSDVVKNAYSSFKKKALSLIL